MTNPSAAVVEQAIRWRVRLHFDQADATTTQAFEHWLGQCPEHAVAWARVALLGNDFAALPPALARHTLDGAKRQLSRRDGVKLLGLGLGAGCLAWPLRDQTPWSGLLADYHTGVGERRTLTLGDGSRVQLNTDSAFDEATQGERRVLVLRRGDMRVDSASAPLWAKTHDGYLHSTQARFVLREHQGATLLAVQQGSVAVYPGADLRAPARTLGSGEQLRFNARGVLPLASDGLDPWSWSDGVLSARQMRLGAFVAELGRYRHGVLRCLPAIAELPVSGTFQLADTDDVLALLTQALPVNVVYRSRFWVTLDARA